MSWSHYVELLKIEDALERSFYEKQSITVRWSVPELKRQKASALFLQLAAAKSGRVLYINFITQVSPACDCYGHADAPIVNDIGIGAAKRS